MCRVHLRPNQRKNKPSSTKFFWILQGWQCDEISDCILWHSRGVGSCSPMHLSCCGTLATGPSRPTGPLPTSTATRPPILPSWPRGSRDVWDPLIASRLSPQVSADVSWCQLVGAAWLLNFIADLHSRHISTGWYEGNGSPFGCKGRQNDYQRWLPEVQPWQHTSGRRSQEDRSIPWCCKITQKWVQSWQYGPGCSQKAFGGSNWLENSHQQHSAEFSSCCLAAIPCLGRSLCKGSSAGKATGGAQRKQPSSVKSFAPSWRANLLIPKYPKIVKATSDKCRGKWMCVHSVHS